MRRLLSVLAKGLFMFPSRFHNIALCSLALASLVACGPSSDGKPAAGAGGPPPAEVNVMTVSSSPVDLTTDLSGRLQAVRTAQVRARVEGVVDRILFKEGADIKAGTPLFQIDPRAYRASADAARADARCGTAMACSRRACEIRTRTKLPGSNSRCGLANSARKNTLPVFTSTVCSDTSN